MVERESVSQAIGALFRAIWNHVANTTWWKTCLWICWFILAVAMVSAFWGSFQEYESRAALMYGLVFIILLIIGGIGWKRGRSTANP